jgi:hypothetical protein
MKQSLERKVTVITRCTIEESGALIAVGIGQYYFFVNSKEYRAHMKKHPNVNPITVLEDMKQYAYYSESEIEKIFENARYTSMLKLVEKGYSKNSFRALKDAAANPSRVLWMDGSTHLLYPVGSDMPVPTPLCLDYINHGPDDRTFDLDKAYKILSKNPWVSNLERADVPYYNRDDGLEKELRLDVLLPTDIWNKLVKKCRKLEPEYWSCRLREHLCYKPYLRTDLLGLKPAYVEKKDEEHAREQDSDD